MDDEQSKAYWQSIRDPVEALKAVLDGSLYFGYDPYYGDLHNAILRMVERVVNEHEVRTQNT